MYLRDAVKFVKPALIKFEVTWSVYGLFKQTISLKNFQSLLFTNFN